ncbi:acyl-CoA thioesterase [Sphingomonas sp. PvP056]|uniref:acyl-CoA thioesterase n=1 Tax=Sphingomonas sp. PvP056 TaxID=3156392 RepID=UPI003399B12F
MRMPASAAMALILMLAASANAATITLKAGDYGAAGLACDEQPNASTMSYDGRSFSYAWVVTRHEIDYRGNVALGENVIAETWVGDRPRGARFDRLVRFTGGDGRVKVEARTTLAMIDRAAGRLSRVPDEVAAPFL